MRPSYRWLLLVAGACFMARSALANEVRHVRANDIQLAYVQRGKGDPVVLVHGTLGDYRTWSSNVGALATRYKVISYSRRLYYPNPWVGDGSDNTADVHVADLAALIRSLHLGPAHVVGDSAGATIALLLAIEHPELVRSLVLAEGSVVPVSPETTAEQNRIGEVRQQVRELFRDGKPEQAIRLFMDYALAPTPFDRLSESIRSIMRQNARTLAAQSNLPQPSRVPTCAEATTVRAAVLLLEGENSIRLFRALSADLASCLAHCERVVLPMASHGLEFSNPQAFNTAVLAFLDAQKR